MEHMQSVYESHEKCKSDKKKYIKTWLWRIVINTAVDATRRQVEVRER